MKNIFNVRVLVATGLIFVPLFVSAQTGIDSISTGFTTLGGAISTLSRTVMLSLVSLFAVSAMAAFFYGIVMYILGAREGDAKRIESGNMFMRWGLVALFVMFSVWGIVIYVQRIFNIQGQNIITIPSIQFGGSGSNGNPSNTALPNGSQNSVILTGSDCTGKPIGTQCTISGRAGTCGNNTDGVWGCYANPGGGTGTGTGGGSGTGAGGTCSTSNECSSGLVCLSGVCASQLGAGGSCSSDTDCSGSLVCRNGVCASQSSGGGSGANGGMTNGEVCIYTDSLSGASEAGTWQNGTCVVSAASAGVGFGGICEYAACASGLVCDTGDPTSSTYMTCQ